MFPINRLVALLTPFFSAGAAIGSAWLLKHFPGLPVPSQGELTGIEITVATSAAAMALKWLHGHQKWEERAVLVTRIASQGVKAVEKADPSAGATARAVYEQLVSDAEEFAHQPQATVADSPRPESAITPDPIPAATPTVVAAPAPVTATAPAAGA